MYKILLSSVAIGGILGYVATRIEAAPFRGVGLQLLEKVAPEQSCNADRVECLQRRSADLKGIKDKVETVLCDLLDQRDDLAMQIKTREGELANNGRLLSEGQDVWQRYGEKGHSVKWKGVRYTPQELRDQLRLLFDEHPILQATVDQLHKAATDIGQRIGEVAALRARIAGETALMSSKIALVRAGELTGDLDRVLTNVDAITAAADHALSKSAATIATLRTTDEISASETRPERNSNPQFEQYLQGEEHNKPE
jgi:prefoldin subunit 5